MIYTFLDKGAYFFGIRLNDKIMIYIKIYCYEELKDNNMI